MRRTIMGIALACMLAGVPVAAQAKRPYIHFHDSVHLSETGEECGIPVTYETDLSVHVRVREAPRSERPGLPGCGERPLEDSRDES